jgi:hypothetical protein
MKMRPWVNQDTIAGLMFALFGLFGLWAGRDYRVGTAFRMGPGYLPYLLCLVLVGLGIVIAVKGFVAKGDPLTRLHFRPLAAVIGSVLAFALLLHPAGLVISAALCVIIAALAGSEFRLVESAALAVGLAGAVAMIFVFGLSLPISLWPA